LIFDFGNSTRCAPHSLDRLCRLGFPVDIITMSENNQQEQLASAVSSPTANISDENTLLKVNPKELQGVYATILSLKQSPAAHYNCQDAMHRPVPVKDGSDQLTRNSLPYFLPWKTTVGPSDMPPDFSWLSNSCGAKAAIGVIGGGVMGLLMGVFLGAMSDATPPVQVIGGKDVPQAPLREQLRTTFRATADKSLYWCRNFAFITGVFGGSECLVEKYRGKHDVWNSVASGCITGAALQAKQGPQAAAVGCGGFAAFSLVIDSFMGHY